ncbi:MAG: DUF1015 domain-containing protein [Thermoleophilia bacterium]
MAEIRPFRGIRYRDAGDLSDLTAPPYDVLSRDDAAGLRARSPYNAVRLDLPVDPGEPPNAAAYAKAAALLRSWRQAGVLQRDAEPGIYVVRQTYRDAAGRERTRTGFVARLVLADLEERVVLPHEKTHAGPKVDRLELHRAAHADLSQIFLLYPDDDGAVTGAVAAAAQAAAAQTQEARAADGSVHRLTPLRGAPAEGIAALLRDRRLYIADGHHRYETALAYRDERRAAGDQSADTLMVYLCAMTDPGLTVFATHRLVKGVAIPQMAAAVERLAPDFDVLPAPGTGPGACELLARDLSGHAARGPAFSLYFPREEACCSVVLRELSTADRLIEEGFTRTTARLAVTILHYLIFRDALGIDPLRTEGSVDYVSDSAAAFERLRGGEYELGAFLNPTLVSEVRAVADEGGTMPQKSTYFFPKLLTGLVFDGLDD